MSKVNKMYIDWQVARVKSKDFKDVKDKCENVYQFLLKNLSKNNQERVLNYLNGLFLPYKHSNRQAAEIVMWYVGEVEDLSPGIVELPESKFESFSRNELIKVSNDLIKRSKKWADGGYLHKDQNNLIIDILKFLGKNDELERFLKILDGFSKKITHKFIY